MNQAGTNGDRAASSRVGEVATQRPSNTIELVVRCDCGFEMRASEPALVPMVQRHGREAHNMEISREQVLAMAKPA